MSDVRCVAFLNTIPVEIRVLQDRDIVLTEHFAGHHAALEWAQQYEAQLKAHGWRDSPNSGDASHAPDVN
ncbi:MAG: hypothetical protein M3253_05335 [Chloroflexota bacterium]|nr:hypothetical protein [Chloroflexota bacterium]